MTTCPNCGTGWFSEYANGSWKEGYCQNCSHEQRVPSTEKTTVPVVRIEKAKPKKPEKFDWTKV